MSTTYYLVIDIILIVSLFFILATLTYMAVLGRQIYHAVRRIRQRVQPLIHNGKRLAAIAKETGATVKRTSQEIKGEVNVVSNDVRRRARGLGWLLRHSFPVPLVTTGASLIGLRRGYSIVRYVIRRRREARRRERERLVVRPEPAPAEERPRAA